MDAYAADATPSCDLGLRDAGVTAATINRGLALLKIVAKRAAAENWVPKSVASEIGATRSLAEHNTRVCVHAREDIDRIISVAAPSVRPMIAAAMLTGLRQGELRTLRHDAYDRARRVLVVHRTKTHVTSMVPIPDELVPWMQASTGSEWLFPSPSGNPYSAAGVQHAFARACRAAGVVGMRFHDLRHWYASTLHSRGIDIGLLATLLGHSTRTGTAVTRRYAHATNDAYNRVRAALNAVGNAWATSVNSESKPANPGDQPNA